MNEYEIYRDPCYYDQWAVRPKGCKDFMKTNHFESLDEAEAFKYAMESEC